MSFQPPPVSTTLKMCRPRDDGTYDVYPVIVNVAPEDIRQALDEANWKLAIVRDRDGRQLMLYGSSIVGLDATEDEPDRLPILPAPGTGNVAPMTDLVEELTAAAQRLISAEMTGVVSGEAVAAEIGHSPDDARVFWGFKGIERRGDLALESWRGGMGLPAFVKLP